MATIDAHSPSKRRPLPQTTGNGLFVTDGGLETELVFHDGIDLPSFAAFPLLDDPDQRARLRSYYDGYLDIARKLDAGFIVETPTWRANPDWASTLGYSLEQLDAVNRSAVALAEEIRTAGAADGITVVVMMGLGRSAAVASQLIDRGWSRGTPAAVIVDASRPQQQVWRGTLDELAADRVSIDYRGAGTIVIGEVVTVGMHATRGSAVACGS